MVKVTDLVCVISIWIILQFRCSIWMHGETVAEVQIAKAQVHRRGFSSISEVQFEGIVNILGRTHTLCAFMQGN